MQTQLPEFAGGAVALPLNLSLLLIGLCELGQGCVTVNFQMCWKI